MSPRLSVTRWRLVARQVRSDRPRTLTMLAAIATATAAFTVLTGAADTSKVVATQRVTSAGDSAYDILVRPPGTRSAIERASGQVRPDFLDGVTGGISLAQWHQIEKLPDVAVAAPVAMVGYTLHGALVPVNFRRDLTAGATRQLLEFSTDTVTDRGLTHIPTPASYVYVTRRPLVVSQKLSPPAREREPGGRLVPVCYGGRPRYPDPYLAQARDSDKCVSLAGQPDPLVQPIAVSVPLLIEAVDPTAEAELDGLGHAVVSGRYLRPSDVAGTPAGTAADSFGQPFPVLVSDRNYLDDTLHVTVRRLSTAAAGGVLKRRLGTGDEASRGTGPVVQRVRIGMGSIYQRIVRQLMGQTQRQLFSPVDGLWSTRPVTYAAAGNTAALHPVTVRNPESVWRSKFQYDGYVTAPADNRDTAFRAITEDLASLRNARTYPVPVGVGTFDPSRVEQFNPLSRVPLGGYDPPQARPGDARTNRLLHGRSLLPDSNLAGYLAQPPQLVTTLAALPALKNSAVFSGRLDIAKPISAIRIAVTGVHGVTALDRAKVNLVAQDIIARTGLQVDITTGSSPSTRVTDLPAGRYGRPPLALDEGWVDKGVALQILRAVDRKSLLLFVLVLIVCALFVLNAGVAAVRARRPQLGVLACVGWGPRQLFSVIVLERTAVGFVAGLIGVAVAVPIASVAGLRVTVLRSVVAAAAATVLAVVSALPAAVTAARVPPLEALHPSVTGYRRQRPARGRLGFALRSLGRVPARSAIAVVGLAVGICSTVLLLAVTTSFQGQLAGDLLGDAVTVRVRGVDYAAVAVMLGLGVFAVADVLWLSLRERAVEWATLQATGWTRRDVASIVALEGGCLGLIGSALGAVLGIGLMAGFTSEQPDAALVLGVVALVVGTALGAASALLPARTLPVALAGVLAED